MKRDIINEILLIKERSEFVSRHQFSLELLQLEYYCKDLLAVEKNFKETFIRYVPVAIIACFEAFFRSVIKELVDFGAPYNNNVSNFNQSKNIKFDFDIINAIHNKSVTGGELVSHILPCNNVNDINNNFSVIIGFDFFSALRKFEQNSIFESAVKNSKIYIENADKILIDIKRTFELRHIFCHEYGVKLKIEGEEVLECLKSANIFLHHVNNYFGFLLYPDAPETQTDMNIEAGRNFEEAEKELANLIQTLKSASGNSMAIPTDINLFKRVYRDWLKFRKSKALFDASDSKGGSIYPLVYASSMTSTTKTMIENLKQEYSYDLKNSSM